MPSRPWLRHPPAVIRPPLSCPTGLPRFASERLAREALLFGLAPTGNAALRCDVCGGWHHQRTLSCARTPAARGTKAQHN